MPLGDTLNTRGVRRNERDHQETDTSGSDHMRYTRDDQRMGFRISPSTIGLTDVDTSRTIRLNNSYRFGDIRVDTVWRAEVMLSSSPGIMMIRSELLGFKLFDDDIFVNARLPQDLIDGITRLINDVTREYKTEYIDVDYLETLRTAQIIKRPDLLLERIVSIVETRDPVRIDQLRQLRMDPDYLVMILTIEK